jgi:hypothetical protein
MRSLTPLFATVLGSCAGPTPAVAPPWPADVADRLTAARPIVPDASGFIAPLSKVGAAARFTADGVRLGGGERPLGLSFSAWGRANAPVAVVPVAPSAGDCLAERGAAADCARPVVYAHPGVSAWWIGYENGVEFGWTVDAPPPGDGPLRFSVAVDGAAGVEASAGGAAVLSADGVRWRVSEVRAWDAAGAPLVSTLSVASDAVVVEVDATGAVWPITVDPILTAATSTVRADPCYDLSPYDPAFGESVSGGGDFDGDGYDDVVVGAPTSRNTWSGSIYSTDPESGVYLFPGTRSGLGTKTAYWDFYVLDRAGVSVSGAGDVNGDGYDDAVIGTMYNHPFVWMGGPAGVDGKVDLDEKAALGGFEVAGAGDIDGDGYDDVLAANGDEILPMTASDMTVAVYNGSASFYKPPYVRTASKYYNVAAIAADVGDGLDFEPYWSLVSLAGAGDVNRDGYDDVLIAVRGVYCSPCSVYVPYTYGTLTAYTYLPVDAIDVVMVFYGASSGLAATPDAKITVCDSSSCTIRATLDASGRPGVDGVGDTNGDGYDDIVIALDGNDDGTAAVVVPGSADGLDTARMTTLEGEGGGARLVAGAGDVNGDGFGDVLVALGASASLYQGSSSGIATTATTSVTFGYSVASLDGAGDANGDGYDDVVITALSEVKLFLGYADGMYADADADGAYVGGDDPTREDCDDADPLVGLPTSYYSDADGDGYGDVAASQWACDAPSGYVDDATDCDDLVASTHPGAIEVCDAGNVDEDCDGVADDADLSADLAGSATQFYPDADGDGYGDAAASQWACDAPSGYVVDATDCDDLVASTHPGATEVADDGVDQDCDGADQVTPADTDPPSETKGKSCATGGAPIGAPAGALAVLAATVLRRRRFRTVLTSRR